MGNFLKRWFEGIPTGTTSGKTEKSVQDFKIAIRERLALEHYPFNNGQLDPAASNAGGRHVFGSFAVVKADTMANITNGIAAYGIGSLLYDTTNNRLIIIQTAGSLTNAKYLPYPVVASSGPVATVSGQLFLDTDDLTLYISNGTNFTTYALPLPYVGTSTPPSITGKLWYDTNSGVNLLKVYSGGWKACYTQVNRGFSAYKNAVQNLTNTNEADLSYQVERFDSDSKFNGTTWSPAYAGVYQLNVSICAVTMDYTLNTPKSGLVNPTIVHLFLYKNSTKIAHTNMVSAYGYVFPQACSLSICIDADGDDTFKSAAQVETGLTLDGNGVTLADDYRCSFSGSYLYPNT